MKSIKNWGITGFLITAIFIYSVLVFFNPDYRAPLRSIFMPPERRILSVATGRIFPNNGVGKVIKIQTRQGLYLEIYGDVVNGVAPLIDNLYLGPHHDAHFQFQARATNLALKDMDGDREFEIIAPSFDGSLVSHLNIFRYNSDTLHFEPYVE